MILLIQMWLYIFYIRNILTRILIIIQSHICVKYLYIKLKKINFYLNDPKCILRN